jgi:RNA polymerase sigma factor (sigma-70 family)
MRNGRAPGCLNGGLNGLLHRWLAGDEEAAAKLWRRHFVRLVGLARKSFAGSLPRHLDPEDLVQTVYLKFFAAARHNVPVLHSSDDLWRWLVTIMRNKVKDHHKRRHALKRQGDAANRPRTSLVQVVDRQPTPPDQAGLTDELNRLLRGFPVFHRRMVVLRMQGWKVEEIAEATRGHERTVRRVLKRVQSYLRRRWQELEECA